MSQKLILRTDDGELELRELMKFVTEATNRNVSPKQVLSVTADHGAVIIGLKLPTVDITKKPASKVLTKHQEEVKEYIEENRGKGGYTPPMGKKGPSKVMRAKCPVCNVRKPVQKIAGVKVLKPHTSHGEPCAGGGKQVNGELLRVGM